MSRNIELYLEDYSAREEESTIVQQTAHASGGQVESKQIHNKSRKRVSDSNDDYLQPAKRTPIKLSDPIENLKPNGRPNKTSDELQKEESENKNLKSIHDGLENAIRSLARVFISQIQITSPGDLIKDLNQTGLELTSKFIADELQAPVQAVNETTTVTTVVDDVVTPVSEVITNAEPEVQIEQLIQTEEAQPEFTTPQVVVQPEFVTQSTPACDDDELNGLESTSNIADELPAPVQAVTTTVTTVVDDVVAPVSDGITLYVEPEVFASIIEQLIRTKMVQLEFTTPEVVVQPEFVIQSTPTTVVDNVVAPVNDRNTLYVEPEVYASLIEQPIQTEVAQPEFTTPQVVVQPEPVIQSTPACDDDECDFDLNFDFDFARNNLDNFDFPAFFGDEIQTN